MKIENWLKETHKDIYNEYLSTLNTERERERERVILLIPSIDEFEYCLNYIGNNNLNHVLDYGVRVNSRKLITVSNIYQNNTTIYNTIKEFYHVITGTEGETGSNGYHSVNYDDTRYYDKTYINFTLLADSRAWNHYSCINEYNGIRLKIVYKE